MRLPIETFYIKQIPMQAYIHKHSGGFTGGSSYRLEMWFDLTGIGKDDSNLLEQAKAQAKEIIEKIYGIEINIEEIPIKEKFTL